MLKMHLTLVATENNNPGTSVMRSAFFADDRPRNLITSQGLNTTPAILRADVPLPSRTMQPPDT